MPNDGGRPERATTLVLVPATLLVLIALAAVAVDLTAAHLAQRSAHRVAAAAADDAAGMIDTRRVQLDGTVVIDPPAATRLAEARIAAADLPGPVEDLRVDADAMTVRIRFVVVVDSPLLGSFPGAADARRVPVAAAARLYP